MSKGGTITRKDLVNDDALKWGEEYAKNIQVAIQKNEELKKVSKEFFELASKSGKVTSQKDLLDLKKKEIEITKKAVEIESKRNDSRIKAERLKNEIIKREKLLLDIEAKKQRKLKTTIKLTAEERFELNELNKRAREAAKLSSNLSTEYEKQSLRLTLLRRKYKDVALTQGENSNKAKQLRKEISNLDRTLKKVDASVGQFQRNVGNYGKAMSSAANAARNFASVLGFSGGLFLFVQTMKDANNIVRSFGKTMSNIAGIYRTNRKGLASLEERIISVAGSSVNTATEVANLAESLATLGKSDKEIEALLEPVNNLSIGLNASSDEAGEFLVQMLNTFGESSSEAGRYADIIATIRTSTSLDFQRMRDSFQYLAPISKALNKDIAYTGSLIGILSDNGIKAERAGRLLGTAQQSLAKTGKTLNNALDELNDAKKNNASELDLLKLASELFGKQAAALGVILSNNTELIDKNAESIRNNSGALSDLVNEQLQSLDAHFRILASRWEEYILNTDKSTGASNQLKKVLKFLADNLDTIINTTVKAVKWFVAYKAIVFSTNLVINLASKANALYRLSLIAINGGVRKVITSLKALKAANAASGFGLLLVAIGSAYELFQSFSSGAKEATDEMKKLNKEVEIFNNTSDKYNKVISKYSKGIAQINVALEGQSKILDRVDGKLKEYAGKTGRYNDLLVREAKKLIKETHETEITKIKEKINYAGKFTDKQIQYILQEISAYQALEKAINKNNKFLDKEEEEKNRKAKKQAKIDEKRRKQLAEDSFNLTKFRIEQEIKAQEEISKNEETSYVERIRAIQVQEERRIELLELTEERLLSNKKLSADARTLIEEQTSAKIEAVYKDTEKKIEEIQSQIVENAPELELETDDIEDDIDILKQGIKDYAKALGLDSDKALKDFEEAHGNKFEKVQEFYDDLDERAKASAKTRKQLERDLTDATFEFANVLFDSKIQSIENEIEASDERYNRLYEQAEGDSAQQDLIRQDQEKKRKELEKKKRKEQRKQAIFNKAFNIAEIITNTAVGISKALAQGGFILGIPQSIAVGALGAIQLATAIAQPIPQYAKGTDYHIGGLAEVAEERPEVIIEPNKQPYIVSKRSILDLPEGTEVIPSVQEFNQLQKASIYASLEMDNKKIQSYQERKETFDNALAKELILETKKNTEAVKRSKANIKIEQPKQIDFEHELFRVKNMDWS